MKIMGKYPNTYTFSKSMAERVLARKHGNVPTTICRPSIIICCSEYPFRGWTDTISAGGGFTYVISAGIMKQFNADPDNIFDIIPCDYVVN